MKRESIFFVDAHPDDAEGFAAVAFRLREKYDLHVIDLTRGERGLGPAGLADGSTGRIRVAEEERACAFLGATPHFLSEVNGFCHASRQATDELLALIREFRPRAVFTHWPVDVHADHVQTAAVVSSALDILERTEGWKTELYFFEVLVEQTMQFPVLYAIDVTDTMDQKAAMLRMYECQITEDIVRAKYALAERRGRERTPPVRYAECFTTLDGQPIPGGVLEELQS